MSCVINDKTGRLKQQVPQNCGDDDNLVSLECFLCSFYYFIIGFFCQSLSAFSLHGHRIMEQFGLEGTLKTILQPFCHRQGHLLLHQVTQSLLQSGFEHFQG